MLCDCAYSTSLAVTTTRQGVSCRILWSRDLRAVHATHRLLPWPQSCACTTHRVVSLAGPISLQAALVFVSSLVSLAFAGHLGRLPLSQAVLASSCYNITGAAVLYGLASGMETLCGQVWG